MLENDLETGTAGPESGAVVPRPDKRRKRRRLLFLGVPAVLLALFVVSVEVTSTSRFCSSCHYMKPFYESWQTSSHKDVQCKVCHYPPGMKSFFRTKIEGLVMVGRYWTRLYVKSKPWAEIQDESCLRPGCHDRRLLEGKVAFGKVVFDHKAHFEDLKRGKKLRCTSCHSQIVQGEHITVTATTCFICHFKDKTPETRAVECAVCHRKDDVLASKDRFDHTGVYKEGYACDKCHTHLVTGNGEVPKENCDKCHFERERLAKYGDTTLIHQTHITANKIECDECHRPIEHKVVRDIETIADCRTCHQGKHDAQKILYTGTGGKGTAHETPNIMWQKGLSCQGCHIFHEGVVPLGGSTLTSGAAACDSCHGRGFDRILKNWQNATNARLAEIRAIAARTGAEIRRSAGPGREKADALFRDALFDIEIVEKGKSVHNMTYSQELLGAAVERMTEALAAAGSAYKPEAKTLLLVRETPNACLTCHAGIEDLPVSAFGRPFPHRAHVVGRALGCETCHSNANRHGELTATKASCAGCHHEPLKKACAECHPLQKTVYDGGPLGDLQIPKDMMAEAGAVCTDCHLDKAKKVVRPDGGACVACHDEKYRATFTEWQDGVRSRVSEIRAALHEVYRKTFTDAEKSEVGKIEEALRWVDLDGSSGIHNFPFIDDHLTRLAGAVKSLRDGKEGKK
jgi:nitrate/TMAO reductase-like tetraheme cytochrome c subunit